MTAVILLSASFLLGGETIGDFRAWPPAAQSGYVLGFRSLAEDFAGIECEKKETIRETVDGLRTRKDFLPEMTIPQAFRRMFIERHCGDPASRRALSARPAASSFSLSASWGGSSYRSSRSQASAQASKELKTHSFAQAGAEDVTASHPATARRPTPADCRIRPGLLDSCENNHSAGAGSDSQILSIHRNGEHARGGPQSAKEENK